MKLSVVTTLYKSSAFIDDFYEKISKEANKITDDYEVIFVNDGSPDDSLDKAIVLHQNHERVKVFNLSRNFGHHQAIMEGLDQSTGDYVFLIDVDLEEDPELIGLFWDKIHQSDNIDVVYGVQKKRKGGRFEKISGELFYNVFNAISSTKIPNNASTVRMMKRPYVDALLRFKEKELYLEGIFSFTGFNQDAIVIKKNSKGTSSYTLSKKIALLVNSITSFSSAPLTFIFYLGSFITFTSIIFIIYIVISKLIFHDILEGWTFIVASIWLLGGLILFSIGIIGVYLAKVFIETKSRPRTIVKNKYL